MLWSIALLEHLGCVDPLLLLAAALVTVAALVLPMVVLGNELRWWRADRSDGFDSRVWPWVALCSAALALVVAMPFIARSRALSETGWVDADKDGMLDGFTNGGYDWLDVNGGPFARSLLAGVLVVSAAFLLGIWLLRKHEDTDPRARTPDERGDPAQNRSHE